MVGAGNDLKDNLRVAVVKDLEAALSLAEAMRGRDYLQQAGCRFEAETETEEACDIELLVETEATATDIVATG